MDLLHHQNHTCKFCTKSFPCGRSLGGHMRSHLINHKKKIGNPNAAFKYGEDDDAYLDGNSCKECGKTFQSLKALFGHMKCHSVHGNCHKLIVDSQSDNEAETDLHRSFRRKRSKRYTSKTSSYNSLSVANFSSEFEQEEEVALSLIILSRDKGDWCGLNNSIESSNNSYHVLECSGIPETIKKSGDECFSCGIGCNESEVDSVRNSIQEGEFVARKVRKSRKRKRDSGAESVQDSDKIKSKFECSVCNKGFPSYQALGGHRASHKKFKGSCAPPLPTEASPETRSLQIEDESPIEWVKSRSHECPICFKVFPSGQALGGHKRSHLIGDRTKSDVPEIRHYLDLNLPAPEEECHEFGPWWIKPGPLLGLL